MLLPDSFLRTVPHALEASSRLILDATGWVINSILISFADLEKVAQEMPIDQLSAELEHRLSARNDIILQTRATRRGSFEAFRCLDRDRTMISPPLRRL